MSGNDLINVRLTGTFITDQMIKQSSDTTNDTRIVPPKHKKAPAYGPLPPAVPLKQRRKSLKRKLRK